ncbi:MAG: 3-dehydroquinate synthase family protein, partial [Oscillospiraceae bacterium]
MKIIDVATERPYKVVVGENILSDCGEYFAKAFKICKIAIITDDAVEALYSDVLVKTLTEHGFEAVKIVFPHGEASKNFNTLTYILERLVCEEITKGDVIISFGGGVTGDLGGFAAACYLRGMRYVQIPTTFLSAIDSSVGGKTGVNLASGKNLAGAFWQPEFVICDWGLLASLPKPYFLDGVAEAVKYGMAFDGELFAFLANPNWRQDLEEVIARCIKIKGEFVA